MTVSSDRWSWMRAQLSEREQAGRLRWLSQTVWLEDGWMMREGKRMLNLASNYYLGLYPWISDALWNSLNEEARLLGEPGLRIGSGASRLITGHDPHHAALEREMSEFKGTEACLVLSSGYMANAGIIPALVGRHDAVFSDRLNHASIVDGIVLSRAEHIRYPHRDLNRLEDQLKKWTVGALGAGRAARKLIVTDAVFSMDGTLAPLAELATLKERYGAMLMVDEAHSGGVYGIEGRGLCHALGIHERVDIMMGTFGKAFGAVGAYAAAEDIVIRYLVNQARTFIYNTGLPPLVAALVRARLQEVRAAEEARSALMRKASLFRARLQAGGLDTGEGDSHIVPVMLGSDRRVVAVSEGLAEAGVAGLAIRPPTVPEGTARIRFAPSPLHTDEDLATAAEAVVRIADEL
ncbi:aminotransferase class I/II-fold pyridoxal phosphate-dependent enzyme [Paenibacillus alvei]|uniref:aminotransferase class I/II-fold pyridoxal phosphate-dependent enzyme n=1 Tax=Paenibacillus alvei TaxID=44250 RepID=UPI002282D6E3|nr:8-amino-7-oxononanoate synthase [Paenibacillus alvei]MCY7485666.1 8-amino-7-oxononanoate synthase [Paenibacillus alvei]